MLQYKCSWIVLMLQCEQVTHLKHCWDAVALLRKCSVVVTTFTCLVYLYFGAIGHFVQQPDETSLEIWK